MRLFKFTLIQLALVAGFAVAGTFAWFHLAGAADVPAGPAASPDVYKIVAENDHLRMIVATWQPGQRDQFHSHPATAVYRLTNCTAQVHLPDGKIVDVTGPAGATVVQNPIVSHSFENTGTAECKILIVERK